MLSPDRKAVVSEHMLHDESLHCSTLVLKAGTFSQGSMHYSYFSAFGAEFGFKWGDRRLRLVQLFDKNAQLSSRSLIRKYHQGTEITETHHLSGQELTS